MTDTPDQPAPADDGGDLTPEEVAAAGAAPSYDLPERAELDPYSAAVYAVVEEMERQAAASGAMVALDPEPIARAVFESDRVSTVPRVPKWIDEPRRIGGVRRGDGAPDAEITVDVGTAPETITFSVEAATPHGGPVVYDQAEVAATDAEQWFLAGLAAVRRARERKGAPADQ